ncbi:MAG: hypothetical protein V8R61_00160 [Enterocloster sp.]
MQFHLPVYDKKRTGNCCYFQWRRKPRSYQTFKRPYETGAAGADRKYCRTAGKPEKEIFSLFPDLSTKRAAVFTELAELALDQEKTLKEDQIRHIILKYRNQE